MASQFALLFVSKLKVLWSWSISTRNGSTRAWPMHAELDKKLAAQGRATQDGTNRPKALVTGERSTTRRHSATPTSSSKRFRGNGRQQTVFHNAELVAPETAIFRHQHVVVVDHRNGLQAQEPRPGGGFTSSTRSR